MNEKNIREIISELLGFLIPCAECKEPATRRIYWQECAATSGYCDKCNPKTAYLTYRSEGELKQANIVRRVYMEIF